MHSSTSSSKVGNRKWLRIWLLAAFIVTLVISSWEVALRQAGIQPEYADNRALWLSARHRLSRSDESVVAILGASRVQRAIDVEVLSKRVNRPVVQLAVEGSSGLPVLENLAADPRFRGDVIFSITPSFAFNRRLMKADYGLQADWITAYVKQSRSRRREQELRLFVQGLFAFRSADGELSRTIPSILDTGTLPGHDFKTTQRNRVVSIDFARLKSDNSPQAIVAMYRRNAKAYNEQRYAGVLNYMSTLVDLLNAKGCRIYVLRLPSEGAVLEYERQEFPDEKFWQQMQSKVDAQFIHFEDHPELQGYLSADASHVASELASDFTEQLASVLGAAGL